MDGCSVQNGACLSVPERSSHSVRPKTDLPDLVLTAFYKIIAAVSGGSSSEDSLDT